MTTFQEKTNISFEKIIEQYWDFLLTQVKDKGKCMCIVKVLPETENKKDINGNLIPTNCTLHLYPSTHWNWQYSMQHIPEFKSLVENYNPEQHIIIGLHIPNKYIENVLNFDDTIEFRIFDITYKKVVQ
jgi:hypothetical protein